MAAEGGEFGYYDPNLDDAIDNDEQESVSIPSADEQDVISVASEDEQEVIRVHSEVNRTQPFEPTTASTPYHGREQHEMQTMQHEQSGLPDTYYERNPF